MLKLKTCATCWTPDDFKGVAEVVPSLQRPKKRIVELMLKALEEHVEKEKVFKPKFFRSPLEFSGSEKVERIKLGINRLEGEDIFKQRAILTDKNEDLDCQMAVTSIGYKSIQVSLVSLTSILSTTECVRYNFCLTYVMVLVCNFCITIFIIAPVCPT